MKLKVTETDIKRNITSYLNKRGIFSFPVTQGLGCYKGIPDRIMHVDGGVVYIEVKTEKGKLSEHQLAFQEQCRIDSIPYLIARSVDDVVDYIEYGIEDRLANKK